MDPEQLRRLVEGLSPATTDSIYAALGIPERPVRFGELSSREKLGHFDPTSRQITLSRWLSPEEIAPVLAHELVHQATTSPQLDPEVAQLSRSFIESFRAAPIDVRRGHIEDYYGSERLEQQARANLAEQRRRINPMSIEGAINALVDGVTAQAGSPGMMEVFARTAERGYSLARQPGDITEALEQAEGEFPGTRAAFDFFRAAFSQMPLVAETASRGGN